MNDKHFLAVVEELLDENPFAIRAVLRILDIQFTESVATLAVTMESPPRLLVNLSFVAEHCHTESHVKAVIAHEFLHVLLRHTEEKRRMTPARHLALDAVINAIIHRQYGPEYSSMMSSYYSAATGLYKLLRPMTGDEQFWYDSHLHPRYRVPQWKHAWSALYEGKLIADDIESLVLQIEQAGQMNNSRPRPRQSGNEKTTDSDYGDLLGGHEKMGKAIPDELQDSLDEAMREMNGTGIWRLPKTRGVGANPYEALFTAGNEPLLHWQIKTLDVLKRHLQPDFKSRANKNVEIDYRIPVLSPGDRRAFMRSLWTSFLPEASWVGTRSKPVGSAQVYLDVSGSMYAEMPLIIALLGRLSRYIHRPFWAFSDVVAPALIEKGQLKATTSGGTSMTCVLEHLAETRPTAAVIVTDGYIEQVDPALFAKASATKIHAVVTRDGNPSALHRARIPFTQLDRLPS